MRNTIRRRQDSAGRLLLLACWFGSLLVLPASAQNQGATSARAGQEISHIQQEPVSLLSTSSPTRPKIRPFAIANGASFTTSHVAPGSIAALFGDNLSTDTVAASSVPLPLSLADTSLFVDGKAVPLWYVSPTQINFQMPHTTGAGTVNIAVKSGGVNSAPVSFAVQGSAPGIFLQGDARAIAQNQADNYSLNDKNHPAAAGSYIALYMTGQGVVDNPVPDGMVTPQSPLSQSILPYSATIGGQDAPIQFLGLTPGNIGLFQANLRVPDLRPGDYPVVVTIGGSVSNAGLISLYGHGSDSAVIQGPGGLSPDSVTAGDPAFQLTVSGANFTPTSSIYWTSGSSTLALQTSYVSDTKLTAMVSSNLIASQGYALITVRDPNGNTSNGVYFRITQPVPALPVIGSVSPSTAIAGGAAFTLVINGSNFVGTSVVSWTAGGTSTQLATTFVSSSQLTVAVPASLSAKAGTVSVTVANPGGSLSGPATFTINPAPAPTITSINPNSATSGEAAFQLTVTGTNYLSASVVQWTSAATPQTLSTTFVGSTQLTAAVPASLAASAGTTSVSVMNPDGTVSSAVSFTIVAGPTVNCSAITFGEAGVIFNSPAMTVSGGIAPYTFSVVGTLPAGLTLNSSTGAISGTPTASGSFGVKVTDSKGVVATGSNCPFTIVAGPSVNCSATNSGTVGVAFNSPAMTVIGGIAPYTFSVVGTLPSGLTLNASTGAITGTPTASGTFGVKVTDSKGVVATHSNCPFTIVPAGIPPQFFGLQVGPTTYANGYPWPTVSFGSMRLWDTQTKWADMNTAQGVFDFSKLDAKLAKLAAEKITDVILTFGGTPAWISSNTTNSNCAYLTQNGPGTCAPPKDLNPDGTGTDQAWKDYITALAKHLNGRIKYFELWNEPTDLYFWTGTIAQLARMAKDASPILKAVDPQAKLATGSPVPSSTWTVQNWMTQFLSAAGVSSVDIIAFHGYVGGTSPEHIVNLINGISQAVTTSGASSLPMWDTEASWGADTDVPDLDLEAAYVGRFHLIQAGMGVDRFYWYRWDSATRGTLWDPATGIRKAGIAYQQSYNWLVGATMSGPCTSAGTVWTCAITRPGGFRALAVWDAGGTCSSGSCTTSNYTPNSAYIRYRTLDGNSVAITPGAAIKIGAKPVLLQNQ